MDTVERGAVLIAAAMLLLLALAFYVDCVQLVRRSKGDLIDFAVAIAPFALVGCWMVGRIFGNG